MPQVDPTTSAPKIVTNPTRMGWRNIILGLFIGTTFIGGALISFYYFELKNLSSSENPQVTVTKPNNTTESAAPKPEQPKVVTDETAGWKTYQSAKMGFLIKYPQEFNFFGEVAEVEEDYKGFSTSFYSIDEANSCKFTVAFGKAYEQNKEVPFERVLNVTRSELTKATDTKGFKEQMVELAGTQANQFLYYRPTSKQIEILAPKNNDYFLIRINYPAWLSESTISKCESIHGQMLSTFKFLD